MSMTVHESFITSDHLPLSMCLKLDAVTEKIVKGDKLSVRQIVWSNLTDNQLQLYQQNTLGKLSAVSLDHKLMLCDNPDCTDLCHLGAIDTMYNSIVSALLEAGEELTITSNSSFQQVPGWTTWCSEAHQQARDAFLLWRANNSPKQGLYYEHMRSTKAQFKLALRKCKLEQDTSTSDSLAKKLLSKDCKQFWKEVKKHTNKSVPINADSIGGVTGTANVCNLWHNHFKGLLNSSTDVSNKECVLDKIKSKCSLIDEHVISLSEISDAIKELKKGKAPGLDGLSSEHFIHSHTKVQLLLRMLFNKIVQHGYIPSKLMDTTIIPVVKDIKGDVTDKDNYRPIAVTCIVSKILELVILNKFVNVFHTTDLQFGFKKKHLTDMCSFVLKEVVDFYIAQSSSVFLCFMDSSKAFDKINHWHLFKKLLQKGLPVIFV
jgi:hypothetical protein